MGKILEWLGRSSGSKSGEVNTQDAVKSLRSAATYAVAIGAIQFLTSVSQMDMGPYAIIAAPVLAGALDYLRRWATENK